MSNSLPTLLLDQNIEFPVLCNDSSQGICSAHFIREMFCEIPLVQMRFVFRNVTELAALPQVTSMCLSDGMSCVYLLFIKANYILHIQR